MRATAKPLVHSRDPWHCPSNKLSWLCRLMFFAGLVIVPQQLCGTLAAGPVMHNKLTDVRSPSQSDLTGSGMAQQT